MSFAEKEKYIILYGHLPDIDQGADIETHGLNVGKNMAGMVSNIEDNTMDIIQLQKENLTLKQELSAMQNQLNKMQLKLNEISKNQK